MRGDGSDYGVRGRCSDADVGVAWEQRDAWDLLAVIARSGCIAMTGVGATTSRLS